MSSSSGSFHGRERDLERIGAMLASGLRFVTITGTAGVGKTRLAREFAASAPNLAGFCELGAARSVEDVCAIVARTLGITLPPEAETPSLIGQIGRALAGRGSAANSDAPALLVLDGFEQLVGVGSAAIGEWLELAPASRVVATSRVRVGLAEESLCDLSPLAVPEQDDPNAAWFPAVKLFVDRLSAAQGRAPSPERLATVATIVRRLDGVPLAIELAAAHGAGVPLDEICARLSIADEANGAEPMLSGLHVAIRSSWDLLDDEERRGLAEAAVFRGSFTTAAAEGVLTTGSIAIATLVGRLRSKSLLRLCDREATADEPRFALYDGVREFVVRTAPRETMSAARRRHARYFAEPSLVLPNVCTSGGKRAILRRERERDNIVGALEWTLAEPPTRESTDIALACVNALDAEQVTRLPLASFSAQLDAAIALSERTGVRSAALARALLARGQVSGFRNRYDAQRADYERAMRIATEAGEGRIEAMALARIGAQGSLEGKTAEAEGMFRAALVRARATGEHEAEALALAGLARTASDHGRLDEAVAHAGEAVAIAAAAGDEVLQARLELRLAAVLVDGGSVDRARDHFASALSIAERWSLSRIELLVLGNLAVLAHEEGDLAGAEVLYLRVHERARALGYADVEASTCAWLGFARLAADRPAEAARSFAAGIQPDLAQPLYRALCLAGAGAVHARLGDLDAARAAFSDAETTLGGRGDPVIASAVEVLRGHLDVAHALAARRRGDEASAGASFEAARGAVREARSKTSERSLAARSSIVRMALAALKPTIDAFVATGEALIVGPEAAWVSLPGRARVDLSRSPIARRILGALVTRHAEQPGAPVSLEDLIRSGWGHDAVADHVTANRLYGVIHTLRSGGLRDVLVREQDGWLVDPRVVVLAPSDDGAPAADPHRD